MSDSERTCPCGSGSPLSSCCGPILAGTPAPTAEALMRSRYSAYALCEIDHVLATQLDDGDRDETERWAKDSEWLGMTIEESRDGGPGDEEGVVAFSARYRTDGEEITHRERAFFRRSEGRWIYAGEAKQMPVRVGPKIGRNEPCPCGSSRKYKKCCDG